MLVDWRRPSAIGVSDLDLSGNLSLAINTTSTPVHEEFELKGKTINLDLPSGPYLRGEIDNGSLTLEELGQSLSGNFAFEQATDAGGDRVVRLAGTEVSLSLGDGETDYVSVSDGQALFLLSRAQDGQTVAGVVSGTVVVDIPGVSVAGTLLFELNQGTDPVNETIQINGEQQEISLPLGPFVRVAGTSVELTVLGQHVSGDFVFQKTGDPPRVILSGTSVTASLAGDLIALSDGSATFLLSEDGLAGEISGAPEIGLANVSLSGTFKAQLNTTRETVSEELTVAGQLLQLELDDGQVGDGAAEYFRIQGTSAALQLLGQEIGGNFTFEQATSTNGTSVIRGTLEGGHLSLGDDVQPRLAVANAVGRILISDRGVTGVMESAAIDFDLGENIELQFADTNLQYNTVASPVDEYFITEGGDAIPAGSFLRVEVPDATLSIAGNDLTGAFAFEKYQDINGQDLLKVGAVDVGFSDAAQGVLENAQGGFVVLPSGVAGLLSGSIAVDSSPLQLEGDVLLRVNKTGIAIDETIVVNGQTVQLKFNDNETDLFEFSASDLSLKIGEFITVQGNVSFSESGGFQSFAGQGLSVFLGSGADFLSDGSLSPLATGVLVSDATIGILRVSDGDDYNWAVKGSGERGTGRHRRH